MRNKKKRATIILSIIMLMVMGSTVHASTYYSDYRTVTVEKMGLGHHTHWIVQRKSSTGTSGRINAAYVGQDYQIYARMVPYDTKSNLLTYGKKVTISSGDIKYLPANSYMTSGKIIECLFSTSLTTRVDVSCRSKWMAN